jgi:hypothetical protein
LGSGFCSFFFYTFRRYNNMSGGLGGGGGWGGGGGVCEGVEYKICNLAHNKKAE